MVRERGDSEWIPFGLDDRVKGESEAVKVRGALSLFHSFLIKLIVGYPHRHSRASRQR
jgi:hypothetical protein